MIYLITLRVSTVVRPSSPCTYKFPPSGPLYISASAVHNSYFPFTCVICVDIVFNNSFNFIIKVTLLNYTFFTLILSKRCWKENNVFYKTFKKNINSVQTNVIGLSFNRKWRLFSFKGKIVGKKLLENRSAMTIQKMKLSNENINNYN